MEKDIKLPKIKFYTTRKYPSDTQPSTIPVTGVILRGRTYIMRQFDENGDVINKTLHLGCDKLGDDDTGGRKDGTMCDVSANGDTLIWTKFSTKEKFDKAAEKRLEREQEKERREREQYSTVV